MEQITLKTEAYVQQANGRAGGHPLKQIKLKMYVIKK